MIPRTRFDLTWRDLAFGWRQLPWPGDRLATQRDVEQVWSDEDDCLACYSLRTGWDVALETLDFPAGSEVLMSCMNIRPMAEICEDRGLTVVPIDLNIDTLQMRFDLLEQAVNSKTKAVVHAHVLGSRQPLDELREFCDRHGLLLIEDCAQAYRHDGWKGDPRSDVKLFSFGPLKSCSATQGGILQFRDKHLLPRAREVQSQRPVQNRPRYFDRMMLFTELLFFTQRVPYTIISNLAGMLGLTELLNAPLQNFRLGNQLRKLRKQPDYPLLKFMHYRLTTYDADLVQRRIRAAEIVLREAPSLRRPGRDAVDHGYWLFLVRSDDPVGLRRRLYEEGFDSTLGHKAFVVLDPPEDRPEFLAKDALQLLDDSLYLPVNFRMTENELVRLARVVEDFQQTHGQQSAPVMIDAEPVRQAEQVEQVEAVV